MNENANDPIESFSVGSPRIPTNVITGFLGVGKTTAILDMLKRKPASERWAVLVNEYGEVSIDHAILEGDAPEGVAVREVAGGCICCVSAPYLQFAIHLLLTEAKPDRLIIETTGLGHPSRLIDSLRRDYASRLDVRATVTVISPDDFETPGMLANPVFCEQVELGDVLILNKLDRTTPALLERFQEWGNSLEPQKLLIAATENGRLEPAWLDLGESAVSSPSLAIDSPADAMGPQNKPEPRAEPAAPVRLKSPGSTTACGWIFHPQDRFDHDRLLTVLQSLRHVRRLKGLFHLEGDWLVIQRVGDVLRTQPTSYRRDSRLEVFATLPIDWETLEQKLLGCLEVAAAR